MRTTVFDLMRGNAAWPSVYDGRALRNTTSANAENISCSNIDNFQATYDKGAKGDDANVQVVWAGQSVGLVKSM